MKGKNRSDNIIENNIKKILVMIFIIFGMLIMKSNLAFADTSAYYLGSKDATKASGYNVAKDSNEKNIEATLDLSQTLDKMLYYILTYEEYENKTYIGDSNKLNLEERKQNTLYYLIHNYKQENEKYAKLTNNTKLKAIFENYAGNGNNLSELDTKARNEVQILYGLSEVWAKGEDVLKAAKRLKVNYLAISDNNLRYWASITEEPLEGSIYNPNSAEEILILSVYLPKEEEKTAQNAIKIVDKEIVEQKKELIKTLLDEKISRIMPIQTYASSGSSSTSSKDWIIPVKGGDGYSKHDIHIVYDRDAEEYYWTTEEKKSVYGGYKTNYVPDGFYCLAQYKHIARFYKEEKYVTLNNEETMKKYSYIFRNWYDNNKRETTGLTCESGATSSEPDSYFCDRTECTNTHTEAQLLVWDYLNPDGTIAVDPSTATNYSGWIENSYNKRNYKVVGYWVYMPLKIKIDGKYYYSQATTSTTKPEGAAFVKDGYAYFDAEDPNYDPMQPLIKPKYEKVTTTPYSITVTKVDSNATSTGLQGAEFTIGEFSNQVTGQNGEITITNQTPSTSGSKTITIQETKPPTGYARDNTNSISIKIIFTGTKKTVSKIIVEGGTNITRSTYQTAKDKDGKNINGYKFAIDTTKNEILIIVTDTKIITPTIKIIKKDADSKAVLNGFTFDITTKDNSTKNTVTYSRTTQGSGQTTEVELEKVKQGKTKTATIKETAAKAGYMIDNPNEVTLNYNYGTDNKLYASINASGYSCSVSGTVITVTVTNTQMQYNLHIRKVNRKDETQPIGGVTFTAKDTMNINNTKITGDDGWIKFNNKKLTKDSFTITIQEKDTNWPGNLKMDYTGNIIINVTTTKAGVFSITTGADYTSNGCEISIDGNTITVTVKDTPYITPKIQIIKVSSQNTNTKLSNATFKVNIPNVNTSETTNSSGVTPTITLKTINYGDEISGTIQETVAPDGYRVDNKDPITLKISYGNGADNTFPNNRINVSFEGTHTGYTIIGLQDGKYINGDTIKIQVTDTPVSSGITKVQVIKKDYDTGNAVKDVKFSIKTTNTGSGKTTKTTNSEGKTDAVSIKEDTYTTSDISFSPWKYYAGFVTNGGGKYDSSGWTSGQGIAGTAYNDLERDSTQRKNFLGKFKERHTSNPKKDITTSTTFKNPYTNNKETAFKLKKGFNTTVITEEEGNDSYHSETEVKTDIILKWYLDDQGCVYAILAGDSFGKGYIAEINIEEKYNSSNKIEDTIIVTVYNAPIYTLNMTKYEKNLNEAGCNTSIPLTGAKFEAVRLLSNEGKNNLLKSITSNKSTVSMDNIREYVRASNNDGTKDTNPTEVWKTNNGSNTAVLNFWHSNFRREEEVILYQIKEVSPPEGYLPRNFYLLVNTKGGKLNVYIGYQEGNNIVFNRTDTENTVDVKKGTNVTNKKIELNVGNPPIRYNLNLHKQDIYTNKDIADTTFNFKNIKTLTSGTTDNTGYVKLENLRALDITDTENKKIIEITEANVPIDYKLPDSPSDVFKVQIKFKYNGKEYDHYKDIPWGNADGEWIKDDGKYKVVTIIAELKTKSGDPYFTYELNNADYATSGNQKVEVTVKNTPIVSFNLNKLGGNGEKLNATKFTITEYSKNDISKISNINDIPKDNYGNMKLFNAGENRTFSETTNEFEVGNSGTTNIRFLADKKLVVIKIEENSTDEHYSIIYEPVYLIVEDGHVVTLYKENRRDRVRLSNEKEDTMQSEEYTSFTRESTKFDIWDNSATRHQIGLDVHNLTETWLNLNKIFIGFADGNVEGSATFKVTADKLDVINDTITISAEDVKEQVEEKYFKYKFRDNFGNESDSSRDDTNNELKVKFTVKEISSIYNQSKQQFWAEIPEFYFTATYKKDNVGYIELVDISAPQAVDSKYSKTINDLYNNKYKGKDRYIDITIKGDRNASVNFVLRNPQVKNFDFYLTKYDQDMHLGTTHPDVAAMNGITFDIKAITVKSEHTYEKVETSTMNINGSDKKGILKVTLDINNTNFRKNIDGNQSQNCLLDTTEAVNIYITERETYNNLYYKFRKKPIQLTFNVTIDDDGYYRLDENFTSSGRIDTSNIKSAKITLQKEDDSNDITGLNDPTLCAIVPSKSQIAVDIPNKRRYVKLQGNVWEDIPSSGKVSEVDGIKNGDDKGIEGITVRLHKTTTGDKIFNKYVYKIQEYGDKRINNISKNITNQTQLDEAINNTEMSYLETVTDRDGNYTFPIAMYNGQYYVEFIYNGYKYEHTKYTPWDGRGVYSNATETEIDRDNLNNKFKTITPNMTVDSGIVTNEINNTEVTQTNYNDDINIGISAWTGGFGRDAYVKYSATRSSDPKEGYVYNSKEDTQIPNNNEDVLDSAKAVRYDYVYNNVNFGITPRETVRLKLTKGVSVVTLNSGKNDGASQKYENEYYGVYKETQIEKTVGITEILPADPADQKVLELKGESFKRATDASIKKYEENKNAIGNYDLGVRVEDEYAYKESRNGDGITANIKYKISLTNYSSEIGIQVNELVDYFDESFDKEKIQVTDEARNTIEFKVESENKSLEIYPSAGNDTSTQRNFHEMHIRLENPIKLDPFVTEIVYVTFKMDVKEDFVINDTNYVTNADGNIETNIPSDKIKINVAEVYSYGTYYVEDGLNKDRNNTYNEHKPGDIAGLVDLNSNPGNVSGLKETGIATYPYIPYINEYDSGIAFVKLVEVRRRIISGNVWVENRDTNEENAMIGNGKRDDGETGLAEVQVQLREYVHNSDKSVTDEVAKIYVDINVYNESYEKYEDGNPKKIENSKIINRTTNKKYGEYKWINAPTIITTDEDFTYTFEGVTTGDYYILFTYPDGQTYKTTIYNGQEGFSFDDPDNNTGVICECDLKDDNEFSGARDIQGNEKTPNTREYVNALLSKGEINNSAINNTTYEAIEVDYDTYISKNKNNDIAMDAFTGHINIGFETDTESKDNNISQPINDGGITWKYLRTFKKENIDLGLVERPISQLKITKDIANVKLVLSNGSTLFDSSGKATNVMWINGSDSIENYYKDKDESKTNNHLFTKNPGKAETYNRYENRKRGSVLVTLDQEIMQGATVKIKYKITVTNIGEVDYKDNEFYYTGEELNANDNNNIVKTTPVQIVDYVGYNGVNDEHATRNNLNFVKADNRNWEYVTLDTTEGFKNSGDCLLSNTAKEKAAAYNTIVVHGIDSTSNALVPVIIDDSCNYTTEIVLSKMISSNSSTDELTYDNLVEIIKLKNEVGRRTRYSTVGNQSPQAKPEELDSDNSGTVIFTNPFGEKTDKIYLTSIANNNNKEEINYTLDIVLGISILMLVGIAIKINNIRRNNK